MATATPATMTAAAASWQGSLTLSFQPQKNGRTSFQGGGSAPLKVQRAFTRADGRCELPILHTAGGLVGGDRLSLHLDLAPGSRALLTSAAAQKVYGSIGRSRRAPAGSWARQELEVRIGACADLEWLPQELVLFADGLFEQRTRVWLAPGASWLGAEVVRLGRTAAGEDLAAGRWRSDLEIRRLTAAGEPGPWGLVDRLELGGDALCGEHGLASRPVFGSLVWAAESLTAESQAELLELCRADRAGLEGEMACGGLACGLVARYRGHSSRDARLWFARLWARIRALRGLAPPELPRVWPFQENPFTTTPPPAPWSALNQTVAAPLPE